MHTDLSIYEIIEAFPNECKEFIPSKISELELSLIKKRAEIRKIELAEWPSWYKGIRIMFVETIYSKEKQKLLDKYKRISKIMEDNKRETWLNNTHKIAVAKSKPIEHLTDFKKKKEQGQRVLVCCPFHDDKKPSMVIYKSTNTYHCFSCKESGDSITFVMKLHGIKFNEAVSEMQ